MSNPITTLIQHIHSNALLKLYTRLESNVIFSILCKAEEETTDVEIGEALRKEINSAFNNKKQLNLQ